VVNRGRLRERDGTGLGFSLLSTAETTPFAIFSAPLLLLPSIGVQNGELRLFCLLGKVRGEVHSEAKTWGSIGKS